MINLTDSKYNYLKEKKPLGESKFKFECHSGVECFTLCCRNINITLYPYDILRMKNSLHITSDEFLDEYTTAIFKDNDYFPSVMLKMSDNEEKTCPYLVREGCSIYKDRPDACRTYPVERAVMMAPFSTGPVQEFYFLTPQPICKGHFQEREWTVKEWLSNQGVEPFNQMNDLWSEMDILFRSNPWGPDGFEDKRFKMAFMASYNIDTFKKFIFESTFLKRYKVMGHILQELKTDDTELLKFGFTWIKFYLFGIRSPKIVLRS